MYSRIESDVESDIEMWFCTKPYMTTPPTPFFSSIPSLQNQTEHGSVKRYYANDIRILPRFFFSLFVTQQSEQMYTSQEAGNLNTPAITRMGSTTIMRDSQTFEQCPHLGPALAQTAIKRAPNITVTVYRPLSTSAAVILPVSSIICSDIRTAFILNSFHTCIAE